MTKSSPKLYDAIVDMDGAPVEKVEAFNKAWEYLCKALEDMLPAAQSNQSLAASLLLTHVIDSYWIYCHNCEIPEDDALKGAGKVIVKAFMRGLAPENLAIPEILLQANELEVKLDQDDIWIATLIGCRNNPARQKEVLISWFKALPSAWHAAFENDNDECMTQEDHIRATKSVVQKYQELLQERDAQKRMH